MKREREPIDEFFRESLEDYQIAPSDKAKEAFLKEVSHETGTRRGIWRWLIPVLFVATSAALITIFYMTPRMVSVAEGNANNAENEQNEQNATNKNDVIYTSNLSSAKATNNVLNGKSVSRNKVQTLKNSDATIPARKTETPELSQPGLNTEGVEIIPVSTITPEPKAESKTIPPDTNIAITEANTPIDVQSDTSRTLPPSPPLPPPADSKPKPDKEWRISPGLYYSPEWMFQTLEGTKPVTNFGLEGTFRIGRYSIRTGAGLSITKGTNQLAIEYNEYLGSYLKLDSMTFSWNQQHTDLIPTYYLTNKDVWDSLMKLENAKIIKRYTYLQIPLILGYDIISKGNFSLGFRVGPVLSILLSSKTLSDDYDPGKKQIISINMITPEQISLNWQLMGGINVTYRFARRFGIEIEPFGKYYLNSVYENSNSSTKPWSIGIRAAVFISF
jgi:hypothetical protein